MAVDYLSDSTSTTANTHGTAVSRSPGKRTLSQALPPGRGSGVPARSDAPSDAGGGAVGLHEPFALHLEPGDGNQVANLLSAIERDATQGFEQLAAGTGEDRDMIIARLAPLMSARLAQVAANLPDDGDGDAPLVASRDALERASAAVWKIVHWIQERQANKRIKPMFARMVVEPIDRLRVRIGLPAVAEMPTPDYPDGERAEASDEADAFDAAVKVVTARLASRLELYRIGIDDFTALSVLERPPSKPSLWKSIIVGAVGALLGNHLSVLLGGAVGGKGPDRDKAADFLGGAASDVLQSSLAALWSHDWSSGGGKNDAARDRHGITKILMLSHVRTKEAIEVALADLVAQRSLTVGALRALAEDLDRSNKTIVDATFRKTALTYAQLQARKGLAEPDLPWGDGEDQGEEEKGEGGVLRTSETPWMKGREPEEAHHRRGVTGVARLHVKLRDVDGKTSVTVSRFVINGMNNDVAAGILAHADGELGKLQLPLEITIDPFRFGELTPHPMLVIDQAGALREAIDWSSIDLSSPLPDPMRPRPRTGAEIYASPESFWAHVRGMPMPEAAVRRDPGE